MTEKKLRPFILRDFEPVAVEGVKYWLVSVMLGKLYCLSWDRKYAYFFDGVWTPEGRYLTPNNVVMR